MAPPWVLHLPLRLLQPPVTCRRLHQIAAKGFGLQTDAYDAARPRYPQEAVACLGEALRLVPTSHVVEVGAGTGLFTRALLAAYPTMSKTIIPVEPSAPMRAKFAHNFPALEVREGTGACLPVGDATQDAVIVAQAFHWFANTDTIAEFARVLRPGGGVGLLWNLEDGRVPWVQAIRNVYERYEAGTPQYRLGLWKHVLGTQEYTAVFTPWQSRMFEFSLTLKEEMVWRRVLSKSYIAVLAGDEQRQVEREIRGILHDMVPEFRKGDPQAVAEYRHTCEVVWFHRR